MTKIQWRDYRRNVKYVTNAAFVDLPDCKTDYNVDYKPTFTILPEDHDGYLSMEKLFVERYTDPTEYVFVQDVFEGDFDHWETFKSSKFLNKYYNQWKKKAEGKLLSEAMSKLIEAAFDDTNRNSFQALKYLVERKAKTDTKKAVGRPKKAVEEPDIDSTSLLEDIKRLRQ